MIKKIGRYLAVDDEGFIVPDVAKQNIPPHWQELIDAVIAFVEKNEADNIVSIYVQGSVPRGLAVDFISDLDLVLIAKKREQKLSPQVIEFKKDLLRRFPFCNEIEWSVESLAALERNSDNNKNRYLGILLKTQALHLWGEDLVKDFPKVKPGRKMISHTFGFTEEWKKFQEDISMAQIQDRVDYLCLWMGKRILRTAFEIAAWDQPIFTRDLYLCYETAAKAFPHMAKPLHDVFELALARDAGAEKIIDVFSPAAHFLMHKIASLKP